MTTYRQLHEQRRCPNCGEEGPHFVPPCLGEEGFYMCDIRARFEPIEPSEKKKDKGYLATFAAAVLAMGTMSAEDLGIGGSRVKTQARRKRSKPRSKSAAKRRKGKR